MKVTQVSSRTIQLSKIVITFISVLNNNNRYCNSFQLHVNNYKINERNAFGIKYRLKNNEGKKDNNDEVIIGNNNSEVDSNTYDDEVISELKSKYYSTKQTKEKNKLLEEAAEGLKRVSNQLSLMEEEATSSEPLLHNNADNEEYNTLYKKYLLQSANSLKIRLTELKLKSNGKKNSLAKRLAKYDMGFITSNNAPTKEEIELIRSIDKHNKKSQLEKEEGEEKKPTVGEHSRISGKYCDIPISKRTGQLLLNAGFIDTPTPIQKEAIPYIYNGNSCILHAETGTGKTLAYLLPIIEQQRQLTNDEDNDDEICLILTPTRELSYQVASILMEFMNTSSSSSSDSWTSTISNMYLTLVTHPKNLMETPTRDYKLSEHGGRIQRKRKQKLNNNKPNRRFVIGSAKAVHSSLFGDDTCTSPATPRPLKDAFLKSVKWLVLDEVDRILSIPKGRKDTSHKRHDKPAALLASNIIRYTFSKCQVISASATVGRPLRRELCSVLGLTFAECPTIIRPSIADSSDPNDDENPESTSASTTKRAISIPDTITHYVLPTNGSASTKTTNDDDKSTSTSTTTTTTSIGQLLTTTAFALKSIQQPQNKKILLVITREYCQNFSITQAVNALAYFKIQPTPQSLSSALENAVISGEIMDMESILHLQQQLSRSVGIGQQKEEQQQDSNENNGYLYLTNEDSIRGLHFSSLDLVIILGKPVSPDEYIHIAGRTGRAGCKGCVLNIVSDPHAAKLTSWENMLGGGIKFIPIQDVDELKQLNF